MTKWILNLFIVFLKKGKAIPGVNQRTVHLSSPAATFRLAGTGHDLKLQQGTVFTTHTYL